MTISQLLTYKTIPFDISNIKMEKLFSFFLHSAPIIDSRTVMKIDSIRLSDNWKNFVEISKLEPAIVYAESYNKIENACEKNGLGVGTEILLVTLKKEITK